MEEIAAGLEQVALAESVTEVKEQFSAATSSTQETATHTQQETKKEPERVYELYSWKLKSPGTRLVYITDVATADMELAKLRPGPLGFDLEWKPIRWKGGYNRVALVQLASDDTILLIQVTAMRMIPANLRKVLADPAFVKAGVGIHGDCKKLWADWAVSTRNCVDLALLARTVDNARWKGNYSQPIGLARLCRTYYELDLAKGATTKSNWELHLSEIQQEYAANDSHSGLMLYLHLDSMRSIMDPLPSRAYYSFDFFAGYTYQPSEQEELSETLWQPHNPNYDPGPLPEKKEKEKKDKKGKNKESGADDTNTLNRDEIAVNAASSSIAQPVSPRGRGYGSGSRRGYPPREQPRSFPPPGLGRGGPPVTYPRAINEGFTGFLGNHAASQIPAQQYSQQMHQYVPGSSRTQSMPWYNPLYVPSQPQAVLGQKPFERGRGRGRGRGYRGVDGRGRYIARGPRGGRGGRGSSATTTPFTN